MPEGANLPTEPLPFAIANQYDSRVEYELALPSSAGTKELDFGTLPTAGCKAILVIYDAQVSAAPVSIAFNSSLTPIELSTGGFIVYASPTPSVGITEMSVAYTTSGKLRIWILG
jgi:hypothetical protein